MLRAPAAPRVIEPYFGSAAGERVEICGQKKEKLDYSKRRKRVESSSGRPANAKKNMGPDKPPTPKDLDLAWSLLKGYGTRASLRGGTVGSRESGT